MKKLFLVFLTTALSTSLSFGYTLKEVLTKIEQQQKTVKRLKFDFQQEVNFLDIGIKDQVEGSALFQKPNKMRVSKKSPQEQITISNGKKVWVYTPSYKQAWTGNSKTWAKGAGVPGGIIPIQNYVSGLKDNFNLSVVESKNKKDSSVVWLEAKPKNKSMGYKLKFAISTKTWLPYETTFVSGSARVVTRLSQLKVNPKISASTFQFKPPPGTDLIPFN